ncbi:hypothetical protein WICMUC_005644 [Wickerhamomyces mucosus]|uniref:Uncharacterized protein n=1 Tax=Wickerhamomyces mucosus TaxID=1378264 RepID=A0A9P8T5Z8_9ASCO|nr:hypothetical protein WICMUC_005644 [Wickerhamomyces mucosus]
MLKIPITHLRHHIRTFSKIPLISQSQTFQQQQQQPSNMPKFPDPLTIKTDSKHVPSIQVDTTPAKDDINQENQIKHYIDTLSVFNELKSLGFNDKQSDVILKLIKQNLNIQIDKLNSKMLTGLELENELYLFEAATSELRVEIQTSRENEFEILNNEKIQLGNYLNEESDELMKLLIVSKNDSQVSINDQISDNTLLQKKIKKLIQDLNNKISTNINSDIKSEIESLRWHTTRNGIMAVLVLVFSVMGGVSISKRINKEDLPQEIILRTIEPEDTNNIALNHNELKITDDEITEKSIN